MNFFFRSRGKLQKFEQLSKVWDEGACCSAWYKQKKRERICFFVGFFFFFFFFFVFFSSSSSFSFFKLGCAQRCHHLG